MKAISLVALVASSIAVVIAAVAIALVMQQTHQIAALQKPPATPFTGVDEHNVCVRAWNGLPGSLRRTWLSSEFDLKCRANRYVASCSNGTLSFSDFYDQVCPAAHVSGWWKIPDA